MKITLNSRKLYSIIVYTAIFFILLSSYPYIFFLFVPLPPIGILLLIDLFLMGGLVLLKRRIKVLPIAFNFCFVMQVLCWGFYFIWHHDSSYLVRILLLCITYLSILALYNIPTGVYKFTDKYNKFILIMAIGGATAFFLVLFSLLEPLFSFTAQDGRNVQCFGLTCTNTYLANVIRYAGYFDEPGAMAYWGVFALSFNYLFINNKLLTKVLMTCLLFTLSLAYYIQLVFFFLFFYVKSAKQVIILIFTAFIVGNGIFYLMEEDSVLYKYTLSRIEFDADSGSLEGDNRSSLAEKAKAQFVKAPILGIGATKMEEMDYMADNPYEILAKDGIIGMFITYLPLIIILYYKRKEFPYVAIAFILFLGYMQRPFHINIHHYFILYLFLILTLLHRKPCQKKIT